MSLDNYPSERGLDGVFIRAERNGKWCNHYFTDLTIGEQQKFLDDLDLNGLQRMCLIMAETLCRVGDQFGIVSRDAEDSDNE